MSHELGIPTYWTGNNAKYASDVSEYGYTALEHANAWLWEGDAESQIHYFRTSHAAMIAAQEQNLPASSYAKLLSWLQDTGKEYFVVTSNVDSAFLAAGFNEQHLYEVHGSYRYSQCLKFPEHGVYLTQPELRNTPCVMCGGISRPNTMFFDDFFFRLDVEERQREKYLAFRDKLSANDLILELGVGTTVPRIREMAIQSHYIGNTPYLHINPEYHPWNSPMTLLNPDPPTSPELWLNETIAEGFKTLHL